MLPMKPDKIFQQETAHVSPPVISLPTMVPARQSPRSTASALTGWQHYRHKQLWDLVVNASDGTYTYTLNNAADHSSGDDTIEDTFNYVSDAGVNASLRVDIVDDSPISRDIVAESPEIEFDSFRLVFTLDLSGSMSLSQYDGLVYLDDGTVTTRLAMAKEALKALATEYFEQSNSVSIHLVTFTNSATTLNSGNAYTTLDSVLNGIDGITGSGSTNYEAALEETIDAFDSYGSSNGEKLISYFISDGEPTQGDTSDPVGAAGWDTYRNNNNVKSYAIGIGGIADTSALDSIHNIDALGSGSAHNAIIVEDPGILEDELLSTVPTAFVGSIMQTGAVQGVVLGADDGNIRSLTVFYWTPTITARRRMCQSLIPTMQAPIRSPTP